ncbi:NAD(P)-binding protein [Microthyrium microscopicum]|uniref:NAD(P)-binding protein n=1 Tax=Microthyrium microscopicum TaxID=703497 RepID=A0A6A6U069_9PEZI|nr:NAD(P)-binding protein [Microthyrium microscopicum]
MFNETVDKPKPEGSQAIIKIHSFGLNRMDILERQGNYPVPAGSNGIMGVEFSGIIEELGPEANSSDKEHFEVGDEVFGLAYGGAYSEYIAASTHMLISKPKELSWEEAAGIPEVWITALQALYFVAEFTAGKRVLWHAGASSVSIAGIQLSKIGGASAVYATTRQDEKNKFLVKELGIDGAFNTTHSTWADELFEATNGEGVDVIIDYIGAPVFQDNIKVLARDGRIVCLAALGGSKLPEGTDIGLMYRKRARIEASGLRSRTPEYQGKLRDWFVENALPKFLDGTYKVLIEETFDWKDIVEAHKLMESNKTKGKLICTIS